MIVHDIKIVKYDGMPASAVATGLVNYVLPPEKMPEQRDIHSSRSRIDLRISGEVFSMTDKWYTEREE